MKCFTFEFYRKVALNCCRCCLSQKPLNTGHWTLHLVPVVESERRVVVVSPGGVVTQVTQVSQVTSKVEIIIELTSSSLGHAVGVEIRGVGLAATSETSVNQNTRMI